MKSLNKKQNRISKLAIFSGSLLVVASAVLTFAPVFRSNAAESSAEVETIVRPVLAITTDESLLNFALSPLSGGSSESKPVVATVDTNSTGGYELYFSSEDNATAMTSTTASDTITSDFNSVVTLANMGVNKWGYSLDNINFNKIPTLANQTKIKDLDHFPTSSERNTTVNIGIKIDDTIDSGVYSKVVKFSAIAHESLVPTLHDITTMQQMTSEICAATTTPVKTATALDWDGSYHGDNTRVPRKSLMDTRDNKYYLVSKLADGNCWMSQNLELMLDSTESLSNHTTDLNTKTSWTPENSTLTVAPTSTTWPTNMETACSASYSYYPAASGRYYQGGTEKSSTPTASGVEYDWEKTGIYYNWYSATAGSGTLSVTSGSVNDSICPKGWTLPLGTAYDNKSFHNLLIVEYEISRTHPPMTNTPLNFINAGILNGHTDGMMLTGENGNLWSSTAASMTNSYSLRFGDNAGLYPEDNANSNHGFSVRCVAR